VISHGFCTKPKWGDRHCPRGKPAGVLISFASEDDWLDHQLENDPRSLGRIEHARKSL